ncbi:MAG: hypothetical protein IPH82_13370 [Chloroflexi bacterium]|nr:hypothetical protein [Chloroflexota bacterium]
MSDNSAGGEVCNYGKLSILGRRILMMTGSPGRWGETAVSLWPSGSSQARCACPNDVPLPTAFAPPWQNAAPDFLNLPAAPKNAFSLLRRHFILQPLHPSVISAAARPRERSKLPQLNHHFPAHHRQPTGNGGPTAGSAAKRRRRACSPTKGKALKYHIPPNKVGNDPRKR